MDNVVAPNVYEERTGHTIAPLIQGKIQYSKMKKDNNIEAIQQELQVQGLRNKFDGNTKWTILLVLPKENEGDEKYFKPVT
eukprot:1252736-Ditylum_brightwellii.AAC.1